MTQQFPHRCPKCKSRDLDVFDNENDDDEFRTHVACTDCGFQWTNRYVFESWEPLDERDGEDDED